MIIWYVVPQGLLVHQDLGYVVILEMLGVQSCSLSNLNRQALLLLLYRARLAQNDEVRIWRLFLYEFGVRRFLLLMFVKFGQVEVSVVYVASVHWVHGRETVSSASQGLLVREVCWLVRPLV